MVNYMLGIAADSKRQPGGLFIRPYLSGLVLTPFRHGLFKESSNLFFGETDSVVTELEALFFGASNEFRVGNFNPHLLQQPQRALLNLLQFPRAKERGARQAKGPRLHLVLLPVELSKLRQVIGMNLEIRS
jgi:hypothetical protein